jgi:very-short-patch-repair endonuclease
MTKPSDNSQIRPIFRSRWERLLGKTESPIEAMFLESFCPLAIEWGYEVCRKSGAPEGEIVVSVQRTIGESYRADFVISYLFFGNLFSSVIECDGHAFHEKTKAQAARDRQRDRDIQRLGYKVFRFTGSEINADARKCAAEVLDDIMDFQTSVFVSSIDDAQKEVV